MRAKSLRRTTRSGRIFQCLAAALAFAAPCASATEIAWIWPSSGAPASGYDEMAVVVESLVFQGTRSERTPRLLAFALPSGARLTPVLHVQSAADTGDTFSDAQRRSVLDAVDRHARESTSHWLQLDFEAPPRQREAYLALVHDIRRRLPAGWRLSVTALASWCTQGAWLDRIEADELVPMLYRLGPDADRWRARWSDPHSGLSPRCLTGASGFSMQETPGATSPVAGARTYWFNALPWSPPSQRP